MPVSRNNQSSRTSDVARLPGRGLHHVRMQRRFPLDLRRIFGPAHEEVANASAPWHVAHYIIVKLTTREKFEVEHSQEDRAMAVYKVIELVGTSTESWEKAARTAVER